MIEGMYISASGMLPKATRQEAIANNLANIEVPGYKRDSMFLREMQQAKKRQSGDYPDWRINRFEGTWTDFDQAKLRRTGHMFDVAITGQGFFSVRTPDGIQFTRNGTFARNNEGILVNMLGHAVMGEGGQEISVPPTFTAPIIDGAGVIKGRDELLGADTTLGRLEITDFPQLYDAITGRRRPSNRYSRNPRTVSSFPNRGRPRHPLKIFRSLRDFSRRRMSRRSSKWSG